MKDRNELVEVEIDRVILETDRAIAITVEDDDDPIWIPKSQISEDSAVQGKGDKGTLIIPRWLADAKGLL